MTALFTLERETVYNLTTGESRGEWVARPKRRRSWTDDALRAALDEIESRNLQAVLMGSNTEEVARRVAPDAFPCHCACHVTGPKSPACRDCETLHGPTNQHVSALPTERAEE